MTVLERVDCSLEQFVPRNQKEFAVLQIAQRFDDVGRLARYLSAAKQHSKQVLLDAARLAWQQHLSGGLPAPTVFFETLATAAKEAQT
jgi:hypothetical protein